MVAGERWRPAASSIVSSSERASRARSADRYRFRNGLVRVATVIAVSAGSTVCEACGQPMVRGVGCTQSEYALSTGATLERVKWGDETPDYWPESCQDTCGDCGAAPGQLHHLGCDIEQCRMCGGQVLTCDCPYGEDDG
jgi:hypothetical protein